MTTKKISKDTKNAWDGYNNFLDIIRDGLKEGIDSAIEDHKDPNGAWKTATDAYDYVRKLQAKLRSTT